MPGPPLLGMPTGAPRTVPFFFEWIDPDAPQERPHVASLSAAASESLPALPASVCQPMLQAGIQEGVRRALAALSLTHGLPPPTETETRRRGRQVEHRVHPQARWCYADL